MCYACRRKAVIWDSDFSYEDYGLEGDGIVQEFHCTYCGAGITYYIPCESEELKDSEKEGETDDKI